MLYKRGITPRSGRKTPPYSATEIDAIIQSLGLKLSADSMKTLQIHLNLAKWSWEATDHFFQKRIVTLSETHDVHFKRMTELEIKAEALINALECDGFLLENPLSPSPKYRFIRKEKIRKRTDKIIHDLRKLSKNIKSTRDFYGKHRKEQVPRDRRGRPPETFREWFIQRLAIIYENTTGKKARKPSKNPYTGKYGGPFFRFVNACVQPIERINNGALARAIASAINKS